MGYDTFFLLLQFESLVLNTYILELVYRAPTNMSFLRTSCHLSLQLHS